MGKREEGMGKREEGMGRSEGAHDHDMLSITTAPTPHT